jgi:hypothetical protein
MEKKAKTKQVSSMRKISKVQKNLQIVGHLGLERPEVTLRETKGCLRRGTEKLPLQVFAKWRVVHKLRDIFLISCSDNYITHIFSPSIVSLFIKVILLIIPTFWVLKSHFFKHSCLNFRTANIL